MHMPRPAGMTPDAFLMGRFMFRTNGLDQFVKLDGIYDLICLKRAKELERTPTAALKLSDKNKESECARATREASFQRC